MIAVTGATGQLGSRVVALLAGAGVPVRAIVRTETQIGAVEADEVRVAPGYGDRTGLVEALRGCDTALLVSARESADRVSQHLNAVRALSEAGVERVVYTSFQGAAPDCTFTFGRDHWHTERAIVAAGLAYTFLRDSFYLSGLAAMVSADGVLRGPAGQGAVAAVAHEDVAAVAAATLTSAHWTGRTLDVTGPESLTLDRVAEVIGQFVHRPISFHDETREEAYASRAHYGAPAFEVAGWVSSYEAIAAGDVATIADTVLQVTGQPARDLITFLREHPESLDHLRS